MSLRFARCLCLIPFLCLLAAQGVFAQSLPPLVQDAFKRADIPPEAAGVYVQEAGGSRVLLAANHMAALNPASTMKLLTTNAALDLLGPNFTWKTQAYAGGPLAGDVLQGDLIIKGGGDPKLVQETLWLFLRQLRARGIRDIAGNLVLDRSLFAEVLHDAASFDGEPARPYNAGADALLLNYKSLSFRFMPNPALGLVSIAVEPPVAGYPVIAPKLGTGDCGDWRPKLGMQIDGSTADFGGEYAASCGEKVWHVHPWSMSQTRYFEVVFRRLWGELGGTLRGDVRSGITPAAAPLVAQWESPTLAEVVRDINKFSNNVMARQLLLTLAVQLSGQGASVAGGAEVVQTWLAKRGIEAPEVVIENGAGLSRTERIAAVTLGRVLAATFQSPLMPEFMASMPLVGVDGTMRNRLRDRTVGGSAHVKTGLLTDVRAIAGYVLAASGKRYAVVCIINHANAQRGQAALDTLLQWVYENG